MINILIERKKNKLTQEELANIVGATNDMIGRIERGQMIPRADLLYDIAKELGTTMEYLMGKEELKSGG